MDMVIINASKLRVALKMVADKKGYNSQTALLRNNGLSSSIIAEIENRMSQYVDKIHFSMDNYVKYGAVYDDMWNQIVKITGINKDDFELERIQIASHASGGVKELEARISKLEETVLNLMKLVEEIRKEAMRWRD